MIRTLVELLTLVYLVWQLREAYRRFTRGPGPSPRAGPPRRPAAPDDSLTLVRCARCGVHVPRGSTRGTGNAGGFLCATCAQAG